VKLYPFQEKVVQEINDFDGCSLIALDMGLGKTIVSLQWIKQEEAFPAVVVCPASVKYHWELECKQLELSSVVLEGRKPHPISDNVDIIILNYDILAWWQKELNAETVVIDECHYIANPKTKRTKATKLLCKGAAFVLALSGTPLVNRPIELQTTLAILRPDIRIFSNRWKYATRYCALKMGAFGWEMNGSSNTEELNKLLRKNVMVRRLKKDVLPDLPPKVRRVIPLPIKKREEYEYARDNFLKWLKSISGAKARRAAMAEQLTRMSYLLQLAAKRKLPYVIEWVRDFFQESDEKLVLFARHRGMLDILEREIKVPSVRIDGSVTGRKRQALVEEFQAYNRVKLLLGNIQAAGTGLNLQAASTVAFTELTYRPAEHTQAEDRIHRIGSKGTAWCYYLIAHNTIEERLCELIQDKQKVISAVLDGGKVDGELDVFDQLLKEMGE
jgi:SNF2 family DNA or RNA helicase